MKRAEQTLEEGEARKQKNLIAMRMQRAEETQEEGETRKQKNLIGMRNYRKHETEKAAYLRRKKNKNRMEKMRKNHSQLERLNRFRSAVRYVAIFTCSSCHQDMFLNGVSEITDEFEDLVKQKSSELHKNVLKNKIEIEVSDLSQKTRSYICKTCK